MPSFSVYGADGRRILRGVSEQHANEFAATLAAQTGEELEVLTDGPSGMGIEPEDTLDPIELEPAAPWWRRFRSR